MNTWNTWPFGVGVGDSWLFILLKFVFIGVVLGVIILILRSLLGIKRKTPLDILKERLARGEITPQEYERLKRIIKEEEAT